MEYDGLCDGSFWGEPGPVPKLYQLTCSCDHHLEVTATQAGSVQRCPACGEEFEVPTLRALRSLPEIEPAEPAAAAPARPWSSKQGLTFTSALVLMLVCLAAVILLTLARGRLQTDPPDMSEVYRQVDLTKLTPTEVWEAWVNQFRDSSLAGRAAPYYLQQRAEDRKLELWSFVFAAGAVAGLLLALGAACSARWPLPSKTKPVR